jgi:UDP-2,3-diacylglucosamine pyrophosphatase LpxH
MSTTAHGCFLSDLHLFSPRSDWQRWRSGTETLLADKSWIILGGDIFDFRWSTEGGNRETLLAARLWLEKFIAEHSSAQIVYLLGNHDCHAGMHELLSEVARLYPQFQWHQEWFQLEDCVFSHGDCLDAGGIGPHLHHYRRKFQHDRPAPPWAHRTYDAAVAMRLHRAIPVLLHRPKNTCRRLSEHLPEASACDTSEIRRVFFGHTHRALEGYQFAGRSFYNPGAALKHLPFRPIPFRLAGDHERPSQTR